MRLRQLLLTLFICSSSTTMWGGQMGEKHWSRTQTISDSVYYEIDPALLVAAIKKIQPPSGGQSVEQKDKNEPILTALRYRLLMNLLSPVRNTVVGVQSRDLQGIKTDTVVQSLNNASIQALELRMARLEQAVQNLAQRGTLGNGQVVLHSRKATQQRVPTRTAVSHEEKIIDTAVDTVKAIPVVEQQTIPATKIEPIAIPLSTQNVVRVDTLRVVQVERDTVRMQEVTAINRTVFFPLASSRVVADSSSVLEEVVKYLQRYTTERVQLIGYSSPEGNRAINLRLAQARSEAVRDHLIRMGIEPERIVIEAGTLGHSSIAPQLDRRVQITSLR